MSVCEEGRGGSDRIRYFPCGMWLDSKMGDGHILRDIPAVRDLPFKEMTSMLFCCYTWMDVSVYGWADRWMDGWMDGWAGWVCGTVGCNLYVCVCLEFRTYIISTVTGKESGAGMTAVVHATLHGSIESSDECTLDSSRRNFLPARYSDLSWTLA